MATKAKTTSKRTTTKSVKKTTARPTAARTTRSTTIKKEAVAASVARPVVRQRNLRDESAETITAAPLLAEMFGTFLLVAVITATSGNELFTGIAMAMIAAIIFSISGANINPAVSLGLFVMRKMSALKMVAYWVAQIVGAIAAFLTFAAFAGIKPALSFDSFWTFDWRIFFAETIGLAIFMFGIAAAIKRAQTDGGKAAVIGLSLMIALVVSGSLVKQASTTNTGDDGKPKSAHLAKVSGTVLNPAVAITASEKSGAAVNPLTGEAASSSDTPVSRIGIETIFGPLLGAALGAGLFIGLNRRESDDA